MRSTRPAALTESGRSRSPIGSQRTPRPPARTSESKRRLRCSPTVCASDSRRLGTAKADCALTHVWRTMNIPALLGAVMTIATDVGYLIVIHRQGPPYEWGRVAIFASLIALAAALVLA